MKKWWKLIIALILIAAALFAMYYWNKQGREKMAAAEESIENITESITVDPKDEMLSKGLSYFPISNSEINLRSVKLSVGDWVGLYIKVLDTELTEDSYIPFKLQKLGCYEISYIGEDKIEIICSLENYVDLKNIMNEFNSKLVIVMESPNV